MKVFMKYWWLYLLILALYCSFQTTVNILFCYTRIIIWYAGDIKLPSRVHEAMQMQVEAERRKRAAILESEGVRAADINVAEGKRQARILASGNNLICCKLWYLTFGFFLLPLLIYISLNGQHWAIFINILKVVYVVYFH